jgi:hypothetical protein
MTGGSFWRKPESTQDCRANDDDDEKKCDEIVSNIFQLWINSVTVFVTEAIQSHTVETFERNWEWGHVYLNQLFNTR